jgi:hypothetical protein
MSAKLLSAVANSGPHCRPFWPGPCVIVTPFASVHGLPPRVSSIVSLSNT